MCNYLQVKRKMCAQVQAEDGDPTTEFPPERGAHREMSARQLMPDCWKRDNSVTRASETE